ncbi:hypothetical protein M0R45_024195 [Rubus argutus]|uniref:KRR1 small subunit processome component second KH domain-containing protein n=1 Tax=Rubus argutus TaxID=59490 RepID=A0AAW1WSD1_RUBAR
MKTETKDSVAEAVICNFLTFLIDLYYFLFMQEDFLERVELLKSSAEDIARLTSCQILIGEVFVFTVGNSGGLRIVRKVVEDCILYRMPPADNIKFIRMQLATKKLEDLRL